MDPDSSTYDFALGNLLRYCMFSHGYPDRDPAALTGALLDDSSRCFTGSVGLASGCAHSEVHAGKVAVTSLGLLSTCLTTLIKDCSADSLS